MGKNTRQAMKDFPQAVSGNVPLAQGTTPSTAGGGRGGQGGPTAAQAASRTPQASTAPRTGVNQPAPAQRGGPTPPKKTAEDVQFYEELNKMLTIARLR